MGSRFFPKENLIHLDHTLPHHIHILFIQCMLLLAETLLILKITSQNANNASQFFKLSPEAGYTNFAMLGIIFIVK